MEEIINVQFERERFEQLCYMEGLKTNEDYKIKTVDVTDIDYSKYPEWVEQKKVAAREYKKLKDIEFNIRNK